MLEPDHIQRRIVVRQVYYILANGIYSVLSPVAQTLQVCMEYNLLQDVLQWLDNGEIPRKPAWRKLVREKINNVKHSNWRF